MNGFKQEKRGTNLENQNSFTLAQFNLSFESGTFGACVASPFRQLWGDVKRCYLCLLLYLFPSENKSRCTLSWLVGCGKSNRNLTCAYNFVLCSSTSVSCRNGCKMSLDSQSRLYKRFSLNKDVASVCILQFFNSVTSLSSWRWQRMSLLNILSWKAMSMLNNKLDSPSYLQEVIQQAAWKARVFCPVMYVRHV